MEDLAQACWTCRSLAGIERVSPGPDIYDGRYWVVEHAYPTRYRGWLILILKRHAEALHDLSKEEFLELGEIQYKIAQAMRQNPLVQKEYIMCYAESERYPHVHFHMVPKPHNLPRHLQGPNVINLLRVPQEKALPPEEIIAICEDYRKKMAAVN